MAKIDEVTALAQNLRDHTGADESGMQDAETPEEDET